MIQTEWDKIHTNWQNLSEQDKWHFLKVNQYLGLIVNLDNDSTFVTHKDIEDRGEDDHLLEFDESIGNQEGIFALLDSIGIYWDEV